MHHNPSNLFACVRLVLTRHMTEYLPGKFGEYLRIFPNFQNFVCYGKYLKVNKDNSPHLGQKYAMIFALGHYLFLKAHRLLLQTDNVHGQIS